MTIYNKDQFRQHLAAQRPADTRSDLEKAMSDGGQLVMFAPGSELRSSAKVHDAERAPTGQYWTDETDDELWDRKLEEAHDYDLTGSVWREGVRRPVRLSPSGTVMNGYHRVAAAGNSADMGRDHEVPLTWDDKESRPMGSVGEPEYEKDPEDAMYWELYDEDDNYIGNDPYHGLPHHRDLGEDF